MIRSITITHKNIGECRVTEECSYLQHLNADPSSLFVIHDQDVKEVSRNMFSTTDLAAYDQFVRETIIDPKAA